MPTVIRLIIPHVQISNYGIYTIASELRNVRQCISLHSEAERIIGNGWYDVTSEQGAYDTSDAYTQLQKICRMASGMEQRQGLLYLTDPQ